MAKCKKGQCNKFCTAMKASKGKSCNRKAMLRAVKRGASPAEAVKRHCGGRSPRSDGR